MKARLFLFLALLLICTGAALAQTPDGETPAEETVCDSETGAAYGLCNAYCEAMDCESDEPAASETACTKVRTKFQDITGHDLPCEAAATCPCAGHPQWENALAGTPIFCGPAVGGASTRTTTGLATASSNPADAGCAASGLFGVPPISLSTTPAEGAACVDLILASCGPLG